MLKTVLAFGLLFLFVSVCFAQQEGKGKVAFKANTEFSAQIENEIDAEKSKIGDDVNFIITEDVKGEGSTIAKGSTLYGRVVNVEKPSVGNANSSEICVMFDFVKQDEDFVSLTAGIIAIEDNSEGIKFKQSPTFKGGTILFVKSKNVHVDKGKIFRIKLIKDIAAK